MRVKRIIKGFIYLFPVIILIVNALGMIIPPIRINTLSDVGVPNGIDLEDFNSMYHAQRPLDFDSFIMPIANAYGFLNEDDTPILSSYYLILNAAGFTQDDTGMAVEFWARFLTYETYALIINVIIDVLFIVPDLFYKFEDESIMSRRKKRR